MSKNVTNIANSDFGIGVTGELGNINENKIYYSIYDKKNSTYVAKEIILLKESRENMKQKIKNEIFKMLYKIAEQEKNYDIWKWKIKRIWRIC